MIKPVAVWDIRPWGCPAYKVDDFNGDGKNEILFLQTAGAHANEAFDPRFPDLNRKSGYQTGAEDQDLFCMTLTDGKRNILWQTGEPWALERPFSWNGHWNKFCDVRDLDGDGNIEIMFVHKDELRIYDGSTGGLRRSKKLPNSGFNYARAVKTDHSGRYHIFTKSTTSSRTHSFGNPSLLLDHNLDAVWEKEVDSAGHAGNFGDIDGDGLDELLIGFSLFDHDGTLLWSHPLLAKGDHLNSSVIADIDEDGHFEFALAHDRGDVGVYRDDGTEKFRIAMDRTTQILEGKFFGDKPGLQLVSVTPAFGLAEDREAAVVDAAGRELSRHRSLGYYTVIPWSNDVGPLSLIQLERPIAFDGEHRVLWAEPTGRELARFHVRSSFYDHIKRHRLDELPNASELIYYYGVGHCTAVGDIDEDGRDELLVNDRETVWIFQNERG